MDADYLDKGPTRTIRIQIEFAADGNYKNYQVLIYQQTQEQHKLLWFL